MAALLRLVNEILRMDCFSSMVTRLKGTADSLGCLITFQSILILCLFIYLSQTSVIQLSNYSSPFDPFTLHHMISVKPMFSFSTATPSLLRYLINDYFTHYSLSIFLFISRLFFCHFAHSSVQLSLPKIFICFFIHHPFINPFIQSFTQSSLHSLSTFSTFVH